MPIKKVIAKKYATYIIELFFAKNKEDEDFLTKTILGIMNMKKKQCIHRAVKFWSEEFDYPTMTETERKFYKEKIERFKEYMEE